LCQTVLLSTYICCQHKWMDAEDFNLKLQLVFSSQIRCFINIIPRSSSSNWTKMDYYRFPLRMKQDIFFSQNLEDARIYSTFPKTPIKKFGNKEKLERVSFTHKTRIMCLVIIIIIIIIIPYPSLTPNVVF
jgi:hypothetical protein